MNMFGEMLFRFRITWVWGRFGGGKTSFAVKTALDFVAEGLCHRIVTNTPLKWGRLVDVVSHEDVMDVTHSIILLDEAWRTMKRGRRGEDALDQWLAYLRKRNQFVLMASVRKVHKEVDWFKIGRRFNFLPFGVPLWWYKWEINTGMGIEKGDVYWWFPTRIFDYYYHELPELPEFGVYEPDYGGDGDQNAAAHADIYSRYEGTGLEQTAAGLDGARAKKGQSGRFEDGDQSGAVGDSGGGGDRAGDTPFVFHPSGPVGTRGIRRYIVGKRRSSDANSNHGSANGDSGNIDNPSGAAGGVRETTDCNSYTDRYSSVGILDTGDTGDGV